MKERVASRQVPETGERSRGVARASINFIRRHDRVVVPPAGGDDLLGCSGGRWRLTEGHTSRVMDVVL